MKEYRSELRGSKPAISNARDNRTQMGSMSFSNRCKNEICNTATHGTGGMTKGSKTTGMGKNPMTGGGGKEYRQETKKG